MTAEDADQLKVAVDKELRRVASAQKYTAAWLDAPYAALNAAPYGTYLLHSYGPPTALRPVTGPDLPAAHKTVTADSALQGGSSLGICVRLPDTWTDELAERTAALLAQMDPEVRVGLLLDLQAVFPGRPDAGKEALRALDVLTQLTSWRVIAMLFGGFPDDVEGLLDRDRGDTDRADWDTWHEIGASERSYAKLVRYGDYGILPARNIGRAVDDGDRSPYGLLRYTTERTFLQQGSGPRNGARREPPARRLLGSPYSPTSVARVRVRVTAGTSSAPEPRAPRARATLGRGTPWGTHPAHDRCSTRVAD
ncbi:beta family protein [Streptomyces sp. NPDC054802]|uniref:beta family protein n=1 Tax=Streptomyces collinus TaxID=42684 RepID=UPI0036BE2893